MKDLYKQKVGDTIVSLESRTKFVLSMLEGERPADTLVAKNYMKDILRGLASIQEIVDIS
jgi:hypothetical protein